MTQALITLRLAHRSDAPAMTELHRASIRHYCADHYPPDVIENWVKPLKAADYDNLSEHCIIMVAETPQAVVGFVLVNAEKHHLDKLYIAPLMGRQGIGSLLLSAIETMARTQGVIDLTVSATLNAIAFYEHQGYHKKSLTPAACAMDNMLGCISMIKHLGTDAL